MSGDSLRKAVLGLGSNLGDRERNIAEAIRCLARCPGVTFIASAAVYETPPAGGPPQGDYLNSAVLLETSLSPRELLSCALEVERALGRIRPDPVRWGPRTIDIDLLWIEGLALDEPGLVVPHPRMAERAFAVRPLLDLVPGAVDPRSGAPYAALASASLPIARRANPLV